jgi:methionyl-tRNA formyltransferase
VSGADLLVATLDGIESGELEARPQPHDGVSRAPKVERSEARVNWKQPAQAVDRLIRACTPAPGAWTTLGGAVLKLGPVRRPATEDTGWPDDLGAGELEVRGSAVFAGTGTTAVQLRDVQPEGKRKMAAPDWARGLRSADRVFD